MKEKNTITIFHIFWLTASVYASVKGFYYGRNLLDSFIGGILGLVAGLLIAYIVGWILPVFIIHRFFVNKKQD